MKKFNFVRESIDELLINTFKFRAILIKPFNTKDEALQEKWGFLDDRIWCRLRSLNRAHDTVCTLQRDHTDRG